MIVAILGKSHINSILAGQLEFEGIIPLIIEDLANIKRIEGQIGSFKIISGETSYQAAFIVVTQEPSISLDNRIFQQNTVLLEDITNCSKAGLSDTPVSFILDYPAESPAYITRSALEDAISIVKNKRNVVFLSKFMRTSGDMLESLYKKARNLGVAFFKYDNISVDYSESEALYCIVASDIYGSIEIKTKTPVFAGKVVYSNDFKKIVRLLKLKHVSQVCLNEDNQFLFPSLTSRKGIYYTSKINTSASGTETILQIKCIISDIRKNIQSDINVNVSLIEKKEIEISNSGQYAESDAEKCAFCYTCYRACPHLSMAPDNENSVMKNLNDSCYGCGICSAVCPANAISLTGKTNIAKSTSSDSLKIFCCENSGEIAFNRIAKNLEQAGVKVQITPVSCGGELSTEIITSALKDYNRVLVAVCMDNACRHFEGNKRAKRHVERVKSFLRASGVDENRIVYVQLSHAMPMVLDGYIRENVQV